jgi:hypothetical protein
MDIQEIRQDIAAFADSEDDVIVERNLAVFQRNRVAYECKLVETGGDVEVEFNNFRLPYRKFLAEELGRLTVVAGAIRQKRKDVDPYIDTLGSISTSLNETTGPESALELLWRECRSKPFGETKLTFLTADAGHGKTALLRRLSQQFAQQYLNGKIDMLLLHIDTQGRSFVRLEEAVARDLGQLRIAGLYYSGVIRLIRAGLLAFAVDGFDELLAEVGFGEAYSGLGAFLSQLGGTGNVIASARSAYFEIENYAAQTRLLTSLPGVQVSVQQMKLSRWERTQAVEMFGSYRSPEGKTIKDPGQLYDELSDRVGADHPVLHRPFLVYQMASLLASPSQSLTQIADTLGPRLQVVPSVINALLRREVEEKWRDRAGQPYLSLDQHTWLLSLIADEMWSQGKNTLPVEVIQLIAEALMDDIKIPPERRMQIAERVKAHALLVPSSSLGAELTFDHDEFLNYFLALRVARLLGTKDEFGLQRFCELHPMPPSVAVWCAHCKDWTEAEAVGFVDRLSSMTRNELRSTYLKQNAGLISSQLAQRFGGSDGGKFVFDSMYFETDAWQDSQLRTATFLKCNFVNVDMSRAKWTECRLVDCTIDGITLSPNSSLQGCVLSGASLVLGVLFRRGDQAEEFRTYVPEQCIEILSQRGARLEAPPAQRRLVPQIPSEKKGAIDAFLRIFSRNSGATEFVMQARLGKRLPVFTRKVLPALLEHQVVKPTGYRGKGQQSRYELNYPLDVILRAEDPDAPVPRNLRQFWEDMRNK